MWTEDRERKWEVDQYNEKVYKRLFWGGGCGWCFMGFTMLGGLGGLYKTKAQKWIYRGRVFRVNIVLFLFKTEGPK